MMKKLFLFLTSLIVGIGLFVWIGRTVGWQEIKTAFSIFTGVHGIVIFILTFLIIIIGAWRWQEIFKAQNIRISFFEFFKSFLAGFSVMFLAPVLLWAGEAFRGYVLRKKNKVSWSQVMTSVFIDRVLEWTVNLIVILLGSLYFLYKIGLPSRNLLIIFGGVFLLFFSAISYFYFKVLKKESIINLLFKISGLKKIGKGNALLETEREIFNFFRWENKRLQKTLNLSFLRAGMMLLRAWVLIIFLGKNIGLLSSLSVLGFTYLAAMIPIPAALGSHEAIQSFAFNSLGLNVSLATAFTMIIRATELLFALAGFVIVLKTGVVFVKNLFFKKIEKLEGVINRDDF